MSERDLPGATEKLDVCQSRLKFLGVLAEIMPICCSFKSSISLKEILDSKVTAAIRLVTVHGKAMHRIPSGGCQRRCDQKGQ